MLCAHILIRSIHSERYVLGQDVDSKQKKLRKFDVKYLQSGWMVWSAECGTAYSLCLPD